MKNSLGNSQKQIFTFILWLVILSSLSLVGMILIKETTRHGAGLRPDSYSYISAAETIVEGRGYARPSGPEELTPITNFPPLYSYSISLIHFFGMDAYASTRILSGLLFGITLLLVGIGLKVVTKSYCWSLYGTLLILSSPVLIEIYSYAHSEPLYLALTLLGILLLSEYITTSDQPILLGAASLMIAGMVMTRYIGVSAVIAGVLVSWFIAARSRWRRWWYLPSLYFGILALSPVTVFLIRNYHVTGNMTNRPAPYWHPPDMEQWEAARNSIVKWFIPLPFDGGTSAITAWIAFSIILLVLFGIMLYAIRIGLQLMTSDKSVSTFLSLHSSYFFLYLSLLIATVFVFDTLTPLNVRLLSPLILSVIMVVVTLFARWWEMFSIRGRIGLIVVGAYLLTNNLIQSTVRVQFLRDTPQGIASPIYQSSRTIEYIRGRSEEFIYTNNIPALYFWADRKAVAIPHRPNSFDSNGIALSNYYSALGDMRNRILNDQAILVIVGTNPRGRLEEEHWVEATRGLVISAEFRDGLVFQAPDIKLPLVE